MAGRRIVGGPYFGEVDEVSTNDQTSYLPASADATQVSQQLDGFRDADGIPAVVLFTSDGALTDGGDRRDHRRG